MGTRGETTMAFVNIERKEGGYAVIYLAKEPVNSMDLELWKQIRAAFAECEADSTINGVIFASGLKKDVFTAGLDLKELYAPATSEQRLFEFWRTLADALIAIYESPMVTIASINGACPAGGCCLALCCDYRVITQKGAIGLNESAIGIPVPTYWVRLMKSIVGARKADYILQTGTIVPSPEAFKMGMVDQLVASRDELMPAAEAEMAKWIKLPPMGRIATKSELRGELAAAWRTGMDAEAAVVWNTISSKATSDFLGAVIAKLSGKKSKL